MARYTTRTAGCVVMRRVGGVAAGFVAVICIALFVTAIVDVFNGSDDTEFGVSLALVVFFGGIGAGSGYLAWRSFRPVPFHLTEEWHRTEACVLAAARTNGGSLTAATVAVHCNLPISQSQLALERLGRLGIAEPELTDGGTMLYRFPGLMAGPMSSA